MIMALGFVSTACTGFLGSYSIWMHTFLSLDGEGRALDFPQGRVPCPLLGLEGGEGEWERRRKMGRWEKVEILNGIIYKAIKNLKKKFAVEDTGKKRLERSIKICFPAIYISTMETHY